MGYTRTRTFINNANPVGGGQGPAVTADALNEWEAAHADASTRLDSVESRTGSEVNAATRGVLPNGTDIGPGLRALLNAGGDVFLPAGTYRFVATATTPTCPAGTRLRGVPGATIITVDTDVAGAGREFLRNGGDNITIEGITLQRAADFPCVFFPVQGTTGFTLRNVTMDGARDTYPTNYCHGIQLGVQNTPATNRIRIENCTITRCSFGLFQASPSTATVTDVQVTGSVFSLATGDDLEFNAPNATMSGIRVERCTFQNNQRTTSGAGFAVGLAHVFDATIRDCTISGYANEAIHVEDYSQDIMVTGNTFTNCGTSQGSHIQVISGSRRVRVVNNTFDATGNTNTIYCVNSLAGGSGTTPGGRTVASPADVLTQGNNIICGSNARGVYYENISRGTIIGNNFFGNGSVSTTTYGGGTNHAISAYGGISAVITGNTIKGFLTGLAARTDSVTTLGDGSVLSGNVFRECQLGLPGTSVGGAVITGNVFSKCQYPMTVGPAGTAVAKSTVITGNNAIGCANPMGIYGVVQVTTTAAASIGSGIAVAVAAIPNHLPSGTVITFTGGGVLTLTAGAAFLATSLTGNLTTANIANSEAGTGYIPFSSDATQNRLAANNGDSYWGASGYGAVVYAATSSYRLRGHEDVVTQATSGTTVTLPPAANSAGRAVTVKNTSAGSITLATAGGNIDTAATSTVAANSVARLVSNGTAWLLV